MSIEETDLGVLRSNANAMARRTAATPTATSVLQASTAAGALPQDRVTIQGNIIEEVERTLQMIQTVNVGVTGINEEIVLLCGKTGHGKSTLMNLLAGENLTVARVPNRFGEFRIEGAGITPIGHGASETRLPYKTNIADIQYCDCPGFEDTRGVPIDISNSFAINKLLNTASRVKIVAVIEEGAMRGTRGNNFKDLITSFSNIFQDSEAFTRSLCIVFTKRDRIEDFRTAMQEVLLQNPGISGRERNLMENIIKYSGIAVFDMPRQAGPVDPGLKDAIRAEIMATGFMERPGINLSFSHEAFMAMQPLSGRIDQQIGVCINSLSEKLIDKINTLSKEGLDNIKIIFTSFPDIQTFTNYSEVIRVITDNLFTPILQLPAFADIRDVVNSNLEELTNLAGYFTTFFEKILPCTSQNCRQLQNRKFILNIVYRIEFKMSECERIQLCDQITNTQNILVQTQSTLAQAQNETMQLKTHVTNVQAELRQARTDVQSSGNERSQLKAQAAQQQAEINKLKQEQATMKVHNTALEVLKIQKEITSLVNSVSGHRRNYLNEWHWGNFGGPHNSASFQHHLRSWKEGQGQLKGLLDALKAVGGECHIAPTTIAELLHNIEALHYIMLGKPVPSPMISPF